MTTLDIINKTIKEHPEGEELLNKISITLDDVYVQYHSCEYFCKVIHTKFNLDILKTKGYTLQFILDNSNGVIEHEAHKFVLSKLQKYIALNTQTENN